jgi:sigma54-dependent transcription regulator
VTISAGSEIGELRQAPAGLPDPAIAPPVVAESGDPFAAVRVVDLVARLERGRPVRLAAVVDRLNATYLDWLFSERVVADAIVQLSMNWAADYRSTGGILLDEGPYGSTVTVEDSTRVDPWIVRQAERLAAACREALVDFSRRERATGHD